MLVFNGSSGQNLYMPHCLPLSVHSSTSPHTFEKGSQAAPFLIRLGVISFGEALQSCLFQPVSSSVEEVQTEAGERDLTVPGSKDLFGNDVAGGPRLARRRNALTFMPGPAAFRSS